MMTMREKLIELIEARIENRTWCVSDLAEYLITNGVVVPNYKIGQTVYVIDKGLGVCWKGTVVSLYYERNTKTYGILFDDEDYVAYDENNIFLDREDAERALKGDAEE